jgi:hypothetical protein
VAIYVILAENQGNKKRTNCNIPKIQNNEENQFPFIKNLGLPKTRLFQNLFYYVNE